MLTLHLKSRRPCSFVGHGSSAPATLPLTWPVVTLEPCQPTDPHDLSSRECGWIGGRGNSQCPPCHVSEVRLFDRDPSSCGGVAAPSSWGRPTGDQGGWHSMCMASHYIGMWLEWGQCESIPPPRLAYLIAMVAALAACPSPTRPSQAPALLHGPLHVDQTQIVSVPGRSW